jgi:hypothetical protein
MALGTPEPETCADGHRSMPSQAFREGRLAGNLCGRERPKGFGRPSRERARSSARLWRRGGRASFHKSAANVAVGANRTRPRRATTRSTQSRLRLVHPLLILLFPTSRVESAPLVEGTLAKNDSILVEGIIAQKVADVIPSGDTGEAFEYFCFEQILKNYDLSQEEIDVGWVDSRHDGGIDGFFIFVNGHLVSDPSSFSWPKSHSKVEIFIISCKHHNTFKEATLNRILASVQEILDLSREDAQLKGAYSAKAMLEKAIAAVKADKAKALASFNAGTGGLKDRVLLQHQNERDPRHDRQGQPRQKSMRASRQERQGFRQGTMCCGNRRQVRRGQLYVSAPGGNRAELPTKAL